MHKIDANEDNLRKYAIFSKRANFIGFTDKEGNDSLYVLGEIGKYKQEDGSWIEVVSYRKLIDGELYHRRLDNFDSRFKILLDYIPTNIS